MAQGIGNIRKDQLALVDAVNALDPVTLQQFNTEAAALIAAALMGGLFEADVVDNLTSTSAVAPLSANQGRILDEKIDMLTDTDSICGETHVAAADGDSFTLSAVPDMDSLKVYLNGVRIGLTTGYTIAGDTITVVGGSLAGDCVLVDFRVDPTP